MQSNQCATCAHFYRNLELSTADMAAIMQNGCLAYPDGVPPEIMNGSVDHRNPYTEDGGVTWELAPGHSSPFTDDEFEEDISTFSLVCSFCTHLIDEDLRICRAFPQGIPIEIWHNENSHREPYDGDHNIQFKRRE